MNLTLLANYLRNLSVMTIMNEREDEYETRETDETISYSDIGLQIYTLNQKSVNFLHLSLFLQATNFVKSSYFIL
jgi:hypothetical protein